MACHLPGQHCDVAARAAIGEPLGRPECVGALMPSSDARRGRQVDCLDTGTIRSRLEGQTVKLPAASVMRVVVVGRSMVGAAGWSYGVNIRDAHYVPASFRRVTIQIFSSQRRIRNPRQGLIAIWWM